ncbi:hypothetical protein CEUSTIGMA_g1391.t1 [Chlamydomonas eustigma]|uniref:Solute carrier family 40 member n=1 Tax=Chlamydomonas eustigma TaxID=1157962 RepID=A0A250WT16_9CHLO|nr:hypothetical protein CEUSTIGMA_g1391.t1 [Chlamydomonas eustigma]|eukprot:GAX73941.1 hypothetical protein CEUSTIGMA_g1391.t1 [Chlamydomonas eustigma]
MYHSVSSYESESLGESDAPGSAIFRRINLSLMSSYFLAAWAWRGMEFTIALVLIDLYPDSLLLVSIYGVLDNAVRVTLGGVIGSYLDRAERWPGARNCYMLQNGLIFGAGAGMSVVLSGVLGEPGTPTEDMKWLYWLLVGSSLMLSSASSIGSTGIMIAVEKRMPKLLCGENSQALSQMNASFRAIDLICLLASPILSGCLMTYLSPASAVMVLGVYGLLAWAPELWLLRWACHASSKLSAPSTTNKEAEQQGGTATRSNGLRMALISLYSSWVVYCGQDVLLPNIALGLLYMTVLSLGFLMTSYLKWCGLTEAEVSLYRGVGALTGLLATLIFPAMSRKIGNVRTGLLGISYQLLALSIGVVPVLLYTMSWSVPSLGGSLDQNSTSLSSEDEASSGTPSLGVTRLLISSVVASRTGLWLYDMAVTQLVQDQVLPDELGTVCGVQSSIQAGCETLSFLAGVFLKDPSEFWTLMLGSLCVVSAAWLLYAIYMSRRRLGGSLSECGVDNTSQSRQQHDEECKGLLSQHSSPGRDSQISLAEQEVQERTLSISDPRPLLADEINDNKVLEITRS